jgi:hypothetical protein
MKKSVIKVVCSTALLVLGSGVAAQALATTWSFNGTATNTAGGVTSNASAWSNSVGSANVQLETATLNFYGSSGMGITNKDAPLANGGSGSGAGTDPGEGVTPEHSIDNNGRVDSVLFNFGSANRVNLTSTSFGWVQGDSDFSVWAYTGLAGTAPLANLTYSNLTSNGWSLVGNYNGGSSAGSKTFANSIYSSYWLVGAYSGTSTSGAIDAGNDYFKLYSVSGTSCVSGQAGCGGGGGHVPEPGTLLLLGIGLLGLMKISPKPALRKMAV